MAGLVPAIHAKTTSNRDTTRMTPLTFIIPHPYGVDARDTRGHDALLIEARQNIESET
ncbi:MAG TPA: hypothetical protein VIF88_11255 [Methylocystis sp.]|jgi:hypothetical protein